MIIVTGPVFIRIDQRGSVPVLELLFNKVDIYSEAHFYLAGYSVKVIFSGAGTEKLNRSDSGHVSILVITLVIILLM